MTPVAPEFIRLEEAARRLERAIARLEAAVGGKRGRVAAAPAVASEIGVRVEAALAQIERLLAGEA